MTNKIIETPSYNDSDQTKVFRILSFDGGGVHAVAYLPVLKIVEKFVLAYTKHSNLLASGRFNTFVGTSTGAIVATALKLGLPADRILALYEGNANAIFKPRWISDWFFQKYSSAGLQKALLAEFGDILWSDLPKDDGVELIVTLWNISRGKRAFVSSDPSRKGQEMLLRSARVADIVTAGCSAPTYFPPRAFGIDIHSSEVYCDGGITGLNNPAALGVSLTLAEIRKNSCDCQVLSFGTGNDAQIPRKHSIISGWHLADSAKLAVDALMASTSSLMDDFHVTLGTSLGVKVYFRTTYDRPQNTPLDAADSVTRLRGLFDKKKLTYLLKLAEDQPIQGILTTEALTDICADGLKLSQPCVAPDLQRACTIDENVEQRPSPAIQSWELRGTWAHRPLLTLVLLSIALVVVGGWFLSWHINGLRRGAVVDSLVFSSLTEPDANRAASLAIQAHHMNANLNLGRDLQTISAIREAAAKSYSSEAFTTEWSIFAMRFCPKHKWLLMGDSKGGISIRRTDNLSVEVAKVHNHSELVGHIAVDPAERFAASCAGGELVIAAIGADANLTSIYRSRDLEPSVVEFSEDGSQILLGGAKGAAVADVSPDGTSVSITSQTDLAIRDIQFHPRGNGAAAVADVEHNQCVYVWDTLDLRRTPLTIAIASEPSQSEPGAIGLAFSRDGEKLFVGCFDRGIRIWNTIDFKKPPVVLNGHKDAVSRIVMTRNKNRFFSVGIDDGVRVWDASVDPPVGREIGTKGASLIATAFLEDVEKFAVSSDVHVTTVYDVRDGSPLERTVKAEDWRHVVYGLDNGEVVMSSRENPIPMSLDVTTSNVTEYNVPPDWPANVQRLAVGGSLVVTASGDRRVQAWQRAGRSISAIGTAVGQYAWPVSLDVDPSGKFGAAVESDASILCFMARNGAELTTNRLLLSRRPIVCKFAPDGEYLAVGSELGSQGELCIYRRNINELLLTRRFVLSSTPIAIDFNWDGRFVAVGDKAGKIHVNRNWLRYGKFESAEAGAGHQLVHDVKFHPRDNRLLTLGNSSIVTVWTSEGGLVPTMRWQPQAGKAWHADFSNNGDEIIAISQLNTVVATPLNVNEAVERIERRLKER